MNSKEFYFYINDDDEVRILLSEIPKDTKILQAVPENDTITDFRLLGHLKKLKVFSAEDCTIFRPLDASMGTLITLKELNIQHNYITDISAVASLTNLKIFNFHNNGVVSLEPLRNLTKLEKLDCSDNEIEELEPLRNLTKLNTLFVQENWFWNIRPLISLNKLEKISLQDKLGDKIDLVTFKGFPENAIIGVTRFGWLCGFYFYGDKEKTQEILEISGTSKFSKIKKISVEQQGKQKSCLQWMRMEDLVMLYEYF